MYIFIFIYIILIDYNIDIHIPEKTEENLKFNFIIRN